MKINFLGFLEVCERCGEKVSYKDCGILPPLNKKTSNTTILCDSILCMTAYFNEAEHNEGLEKIKFKQIETKRLYQKHINGFSTDEDKDKLIKLLMKEVRE